MTILGERRLPLLGRELSPFGIQNCRDRLVDHRGVRQLRSPKRLGYGLAILRRGVDTAKHVVLQQGSLSAIVAKTDLF